MGATQGPNLTPGQWAVLGAIAEGPTHGFAVAQALSEDGELGRVWTLPRPLVYSVLRKLLKLGLVETRSTEPSELGPTRTIVAVTPEGRRAMRWWLAEPVDHVRDVRSMLLLKIVLLERSGRDWRPLVEHQRDRLAPQLEGLERLSRQTAGFERVLAEWRYTSSRATCEFLDSIIASG